METPQPATPAAAAVPVTARDRIVLAIGRALSSLFLALGILAALRTGMDETAQLTLFTVTPAIAAVWVVLGVVGVALTAGPRRCRVFLLVQGPLLLLWGVGSLVADGDDGLFVGDGPLIALHLIAGALSLIAALFPVAGAVGAEGSAATRPPTPSGAPDRTR